MYLLFLLIHACFYKELANRQAEEERARAEAMRKEKLERERNFELQRTREAVLEWRKNKIQVNINSLYHRGSNYLENTACITYCSRF